MAGHGQVPMSDTEQFEADVVFQCSDRRVRKMLTGARVRINEDRACITVCIGHDVDLKMLMDASSARKLGNKLLLGAREAQSRGLDR